MRIIPFDSRYRDDMIFMILEAKNALGRAPRLNDDLLDIEKNYLQNGDMFWLALDDNDRVIGSVGYRSIEGTKEVFLHRLFVKCDQKRRGIGSRLLETAENYLASQGKTAVRVHLGQPREQWFEAYRFYPRHGYAPYDECHMMKRL